MTGLREHHKNQANLKRDKVRAYYLENPEATIHEVAVACNSSVRTVAGIRSTMAADGVLRPNRNNKQAELSDNIPPPPPPKPTRYAKPVAIPGSIIDDAAMAKLASASADSDLDFLNIDIDALDDESLRKRLLKGIIKIAFTPGVHPDVQLSATQVWVKLKDMARAKELGPGKPKTRADAVARLTEMLVACGPSVAVEAMTIAFNVKETDDAPTSQGNETDVAPQGDPSPPQADPVAPPDTA